MHAKLPIRGKERRFPHCPLSIYQRVMYQNAKKKKKWKASFIGKENINKNVSFQCIELLTYKMQKHMQNAVYRKIQ